MLDSEVVASIADGDPRGLAAAYDRYSGVLFRYCQSLVREPADAADVVQDTFLILAAKISSLRDPERLRAWLFAVARNECLHRLKANRTTAPMLAVPDTADDSADVSAEAERAETRALIRAAAEGLNAGERDVITQLWHGLDVPEVATVLGLSRNHAYSLFSRARDQLEASVGVLLVGRSGRKDCAALDRMLTGWDGQLTALLRKRVGRHIERCAVCTETRRREMRPAVLLGLTPAAVVGLAVVHEAAGASGAAGGPGLPLRQRAEVLHLAADRGPRAAAKRAAVTRRSGPFGTNGFPKAAGAGHAGLLRPPLAIAGGVAVAAAVIVAIAIVPHSGSRPPGGGTAAAGLPFGGAPPSPTPSRTPSRTPSPTPNAGTRRAGAPLAPGRAGASTAVPSASPGTGTQATPKPGAQGGSPTGAATGTPASSSSPSSSPSATVTVSTPVSTGTLSVSPTTVLLSPLLGGTLTLTAHGGPVDWSISESSSLLGELTVTPSSGTLAAGGTATVQLAVTGLVALDSTLTVEPGPSTVTVVLGLGLPPG